MGFGAGAQTKRQLFCASRLYNKRDVGLEYDVVTIDVAAMFRKLVPFTLGSEMTPLSAVQRIFLPAINRFVASTVVFCFDSPSKIPEVRNKFHSERRYKASTREPRAGEIRCPEDGRNYTVLTYPAGDVDIAALTMTTMPCAWAKFWNSARGKVALWQCIEDSIQYLITTRQVRGGVRYIIDGQVPRSYWVHPAVHADEEVYFLHNYGEGDMKCILWAAHFFPQKSLLMTIDWDVILAVLLYDAPLDVWIGTVFSEDATIDGNLFRSQTVELTKRGALKRWGVAHPAYEIMHQPFPEWTRLERQHYLMLSLCIGGVDYCYGLGSFGFTESRLSELVTSGKYSKFMVNMFDPDSPYERCIKFYPDEFINCIKSAWSPRHCRHKAPEGSTIGREFSLEVRNILYCVMYFGGFDSQRLIGGPPPPPADEKLMYSGAKTMEDIFSMTFAPVHFCEEYPCDGLTLSHAPSLTYCGHQLESINNI